MENILFIVIISCLGFVLAWYVKNEKIGSQGEFGFLALTPDEKFNIEGGASYRIKPARGRNQQDGQYLENPEQTDKVRRRFKAAERQKPVAYRSGARAPQYKVKERIQPGKSAQSAANRLYQ